MSSDQNDYEPVYPKEYAERIRGLTPKEQDAVKKFWRSVVMRSRAFSEENGRLLCSSSNVRSCSCCPYGYHIDLDFVRYCEALANAKPSEEQLRRRSRRRSRKSMEFMLGLDSLFDQWDAAERVQMVPEEPDSPRVTHQPAYTTSTPYANGNHIESRQRASSVPRFTYGGLTRSDSPFATSSSTCSSLRGGGAENDEAQSAALFPQRHPANSPPETRAFLRDALDEVCSDFERTLERASTKRKKATATATVDTPLVGGGRVGVGVLGLVGGFSDRNNNYTMTKSTYVEKRSCKTWEEYVHALDSCVTGNKSPRSSFTRSATLPLPPSPHKERQHEKAQQHYESYVRANVEANAKSSLERIPPPPPPRRHALLSSQTTPKTRSITPDLKSALSQTSLISPTATLDGGASSTDAQTLCNIRQQMALSLKRMKDLEEQVKTIPELKNELSKLRDDKQNLQSTLQRKEEELQRARDSPRPPSTPSPTASQKFPSPVQFTAQRISPISLESLGARLRTNSSSSEKQLKTTLRRDVGTMCGLHTTRDIAVGSPVITLRTVGTSPVQTLNLSEVLYTRYEMNEHIEKAVSTYEEKRTLAQLKKLISVGTQMYVPKRDVREYGVQTIPERPAPKHTVGTTAKPSTRENFVNCKPDVRSVGCSEDRLTDILCEKCAIISKCRTVACGTDADVSEEKRSSAAVSLKLLDMQGRSKTFSLGDNEKLQLKRKTIGTQYTPLVVHTIGMQTLPSAVHSMGVQNSPLMQNCSTQSNAEMTTRQTDTRDLIRLCATQTRTEEIAAPVPEAVPTPPPPAPPKPILLSSACNTDARPTLRSSSCNTEALRMVDHGMNTPAPAALRHAGSNTESVRTRDIACGDIVKPHISIACADNYCDSCKDAIKHLAKDFTKVLPPQPPASPLPQRAVDSSKIPRPTHLTSPSPQRKKFQRQNTYTITPSPTPSPVAEKKTILSNLAEKPPRKLSESSGSPEADDDASLPTRPPATTIEPLEIQETSAKPEKSAYEFDGLKDLLVREETRVRISWSRDSSPVPPKDGTPSKSLESSLHEKMQTSLESSRLSKSSSPDESKGARRKTVPEKSSQSDETETTTTEDTVIEVKPPRERIQPSKEVCAALKTLNESLRKLNKTNAKSASVKEASAIVAQEWFSIASTEVAYPPDVEDYLEAFRNISVPLLQNCVNMKDSNGNTVMHYAVSHGNFEVVSTLLDSKVCNVNQMNNAGYTCVMLVSLAKLKNVAHRSVVQRLFQMADVNIRAKKHCQTALMLAVSHGNLDMVELLLAAGADINIQDEDGSTALMCAAEHGRIDIVKHLLSQAVCDSLVQDVDGSTAFKIAWQAGHRDIGLMLYVHEQMLRSKMPNKGDSPKGSSLSPRNHKRQPSQ